MRLTTYFFNKDNIVVKLQELEAEPAEKERLFAAVQELAEYKLLGCVLDRLSQEDKETFLEHIHNESEETLAFLKDKMQDAEDLLTTEANLLEAEILKDIEEMKGD
jgi:hypothetical protein